MTNKELAEIILEKAGGTSNIRDAANCMTRLRMHLNDPSKLSQADLENTEGVLGVVFDGDYLQVILGPGTAKKVADEVLLILGPSHSSNFAGDWEANKEKTKAKQKKGGIQDLLKTIAGIFVPLIPAIIAAGLFNGFASLIGQLLKDGTIVGEFWTLIQTVLSLFGASFLSYFAIFTGVQGAKVFGATPALGGMIGAMSIGSQIVDISKALGLYNEAVPLQSILTTGKGGIIGVIIGVWILSKIENWIRSRIPDIFDLVVTPFLSLLITGLLFVFAIMPVAGFISDALVAFLSFFINSSNPVISAISGFILAALFLPMVLLGLHHGLIPIYSIQLEAMGGVTLFPVLACAGAGQVGAAIAIYCMAKKYNDQKLQGIIAGALPAGLMGVGEPLIYGVTLPLGSPFITAGIGAGFGGAYVMATHVTASAWGPSGLVAIPLMQGVNGMLNYTIGLVIAGVMGFVVTKLFIKPEKNYKARAVEEIDHLEEDLDHLDKNQDLKAFTDGKAVPIEEVPDPVFSKKSMGDGFAIQPDSGKVYSPVSGEVLSVFPGGHAIGIQDSQGREVLIHIGLDTVTLKGEGFTTHIKEGSSVKAGDLITEFDQDLLKSKDLNDIIICVLTNTSYFKKTELLKTGPVKTGEPVFHTEK